NPAGGWIAVWSEIASSDLGNPYPTTSLNYSLSNADGSSWSAPAAILNSSSAMFNLNLAEAGNEVVLTYLSTPEGPLRENQTLYSAVWNGAKWSTPAALLPAQTIRTTELAGDSNGTASLTVTTGNDQLLILDWNGTEWSAANQI